MIRSPSSQGVKTCFKCGVSQPITEFYKHPMMADGHLNKCKTCTKRDVKDRYRDTIEDRHAYERKRNSTPERKAKLRVAHRRYQKRHPVRSRAHAKVAYALRAGHLERKPCEVCGDPKVQAHHHDYDKPLDVRWLCFACHRKEHGQVTTSPLVATKRPT